MSEKSAALGLTFSEIGLGENDCRCRKPPCGPPSKRGRFPLLTKEGLGEVESLVSLTPLLQQALTKEGLEEVPTALTLIRAPENRGYSAGNNIGIGIALERNECDYIWILNNDTIVEDGAVEKLIDYANNLPGTGIVGSTIVDFYDRNVVQYAGGARFNPWLIMYRPAFGKIATADALTSKREPRLDYISGAAMFIRADLVRQTGGLDQAYFLYFEELDYAQRVKRLGYGVGWCRQSIIYHKEGASIQKGRGSTGRKSELAEYHSNLSALIYMRRFHSWIFPIGSINRMCLKTLSFIIKRETGLFRPLFAAYKDFLLYGEAR
jgi:GT2 family glycosyltransferase